MTERLMFHIPRIQGPKCHSGKQKASSNYTPFAVPTVKLRYDQRSKVLQPSMQAEWLQIYTLEEQKTNPDSKQKRKHSESCYAGKTL